MTSKVTLEGTATCLATVHTDGTALALANAIYQLLGMGGVEPPTASGHIIAETAYSYPTRVGLVQYENGTQTIWLADGAELMAEGQPMKPCDQFGIMGKPEPMTVDEAKVDAQYGLAVAGAAVAASVEGSAEAGIESEVDRLARVNDPDEPAAPILGRDLSPGTFDRQFKRVFVDETDPMPQGTEAGKPIDEATPADLDATNRAVAGEQPSDKPHAAE